MPPLMSAVLLLCAILIPLCCEAQPPFCSPDVLIVGGDVDQNGTAQTPLTAELYIPQYQAFVQLGAHPTIFGTANLLPNGRVLITGQGAAQLYRPFHQDFITAGNLLDANHNGSVSLANGDVLFYAKTYPGPVTIATDTLERYYWRTGKFGYASGTLVDNNLAGAVLMKSGQVLLLGSPLEVYRPVHNDIVDLNLLIPPFEPGTQLPPNGGIGLDDGRALISWASQVPFSQLDDLVSIVPGPDGSLTTGPPMGSPVHPMENYTVTKMHNGAVLFGSGDPVGIQVNAPSVDQSEVYDPSTNSFINVTQPGSQCQHVCVLEGDGSTICDNADCADDRVGHAATQLSGRKVLITGGAVFPAYVGAATRGAAVNTAWLFDPANNTYSLAAGRMTTGRVGHTATLLCQ